MTQNDDIDDGDRNGMHLHGNDRKISSGQKPPLRPHLSLDIFHAETG